MKFDNRVDIFRFMKVCNYKSVIEMNLNRILSHIFSSDHRFKKLKNDDKIGTVCIDLKVNNKSVSIRDFVSDILVLYPYYNSMSSDISFSDFHKSETNITSSDFSLLVDGKVIKYEKFFEACNKLYLIEKVKTPKLAEVIPFKR